MAMPTEVEAVTSDVLLAQVEIALAREAGADRGSPPGGSDDAAS